MNIFQELELIENENYLKDIDTGNYDYIDMIWDEQEGDDIWLY